MNTHKTHMYHRDKKGFFISLLFAFTLIVVTAFACLSADVAHNVGTQSQLQRAVDAASVAGADQLISQPPTSAQIQAASSYATSVAAANSADGSPVSNSGNTTVQVSVNTAVSPATVTVNATRTMNNIFANIFGATTSNIAATATAAAHQVPLGINPNQLHNIALSLDYTPSSGPQAGLSFNQLRQGQSFTICLNNSANNSERNASIISDWDGHCNPTLNVGTDQVNGKLGSDDDCNSLFLNVHSGIVLSLPLVTGTPALTSMSQPFTCVGSCGFKVTGVDSANKRITGTVQDPVYLSGRCGRLFMTGNSQNDNFMSQNAPWHCSLTD